MAVATKAKPKTAAEAPAADPPEPARRLFDAATAQQIEWNKPHEFELTATMPGVFALVRPVDMQTPETILVLPGTLLQRVVEIQQVIQPLQKKVTKEDGTIDMLAAQESMRRIKEMHAIYVIAGFINPPVIESEAARTNPDQVCVDTIHPADQSRFFDWCQQMNGQVNGTLTRFRGEPVRGVEAG